MTKATPETQALKVSRGVQGDKGDTGDTGVQGPAGPIGGSDGQVIYNNGGVAAGSDIYFDDTNNKVGIGTTSPGSALDVSRDAGSDGIQELRIGQLRDNDGFTRIRAYQDAIGYGISGNWAQGLSP